MTTEDKTLLDAPTDNKTGADADDKKDGSLLDDGKANDAPKDGQDGKKPPVSPDKTPPAEPPKDGQPPKPDVKPAPVVPEKYADPKLPEGWTIATEIKDKFDAEAKALNLSQEQYQKFIDLQVEATEAQQNKVMAEFDQTKKEWRNQSLKELGADYQKELAVASKAIDRVFTNPEQNQEFRKMMFNTGLGNWLLMIKLCTFVGKAISEDKFIDGKPDSKIEKSVAERIYPDLAPK